MWQRDALRRLVINGDLTDDDFQDLTKICKMPHGLAEPQKVAPLEKNHIPRESKDGVAVSLEAIFHQRGVNALADDQTLNFSPSLTLVYGDNAAGKTGYIRILKSACRARGQEKILGNILSDTKPLKPAVSIKYKVGNEAVSREWNGASEDEFISRVSIFDTQCAAVYLTEKTDVAFRPLGLDLFDKLVQACRAVRKRLEDEQHSFSSNLLIPIQNQIPKDTAVAELLKNITSLTQPETVYRLMHISESEEDKLASLEQSLLDLQANDPEKLIDQLELRSRRVNSLALHIKEVEKLLSEKAVQDVLCARIDNRRKTEEAKNLREGTFPSGMLTGTGSESWVPLWASARKFSEESAYPDQSFPVVRDGAQCVLCQQNLDNESRDRLQKFESFVASTTENELRQTRETFEQQYRAFIDLNIFTEIVNETINELRIDYKSVADSIKTALEIAENRRKVILFALSEDRDIAPDCPDVKHVAGEVDALAERITERLNTLRGNADTEIQKRMTAEAQELRARKLLGQHEQSVLNEIDRKKKYAAYSLCLNDTRTNAITQKNTDVTLNVVSQKLKQSFQDELSTLNFRHMEVELEEAGGAEGVMYHKLVLTHAPNIELPRIASEGEQRCLSIAAFFAELSTADDPSGIVFDDPMSSLDYRWREDVARRLVEEAKIRQVVVFTHDVVFLLYLKRFAREQNVEQLDQHVRQLRKGAGVCEEALPWVALPVNEKIGYLKNAWQAADKLFRGDEEILKYEKEAEYLYGLLREAWERAVEEVLLNSAIERFRSSVETKRIGKITDICQEDYATLDAAMDKCSRWLPGHDQAGASRAPVPEPKELKADIKKLEDWVKVIRNRR